MTYKTVKFLALLLLFSGLMACAFKLVQPGKEAVETAVQSGSSEESQPAQLSRIEGTHEEPSPALVQRSADDFPATAVEVQNVATNEEQVLSQIRTWARTDPEAALAWGRLQPDGGERTEALTDACFQIAQADPARAVVLAEEFKLNKDAVLINLAQQWAAKDLTTAYNWICAQPDDDRRAALVTGTVFVWSQKEPVGAAQFVVQQISPGAAQDEAVMMVLHQWALVDPEAAGTWVQQFPEGQLRNRAMNELAGIATYEQSLAKSK
jgi:hypothetical protein